MAGFVLTGQLNLKLPPNLGSIVSQLNRGLTGVNANIGLNLPPNGGRQLTQLNSQLAAVGKQARGTSADFENLGAVAASSLKRFAGFTIIASTFYTFSRAVQGAIGDAINFQHELVKISQVTGTSLKDLQGLSSEVTRLSTTLGVNSGKLLNAAQILAQAGLAADKTKIALQALAKTDVSPTFENLNDTTEGAIAIMAQFGAEAEDLESIFGSLNSVAGKFAVESSDIITTVRRTGGAFEAAGGQLNELIALFTSVRATTRESAESIATGFRTIFTRIQRTRTIGFLDDLGISLRNMEGQFVGPYEAVKRLAAALDDLPTTDPRFSQIIEELGGFRQVSKVIPLIKEFGTAQQALLVAQRGTNSLTDDADKANQSLLIRLIKVKEEFQDLIRTIGNNQAFQNIIDNSLKLASAFIKVAKSLEPLLPLIAGIGLFKGAQAATGIGSGFKKALGFNKGGLVPGSGNGDTVPAMLEPGEFVLRKNAVQAIGAGNLHGMNRQKFASGGNITAKSLTGVVSRQQMDAIAESLLTGAAKTRYAQSVGDGKRAAILFNNADTKGAVLQAYGSSTGGYKAKQEAEKSRKADEKSIGEGLIPADQRVFGSISLRPEARQAFKQGFVRMDVDGKTVPVPYDLHNVSVSEPYSSKVEKESFVPNVKSAIEQGAKNMMGFFGAKNLNPIHITNESGILGSLFESSLLALGAPYNSKGLDDNRTFDFRNGLGNLAGAFGESGAKLANRPTDAKLSYNDSAEASLNRKIKSYYTELLSGPRAKRFAGGGNTGTDSVPALLTPGEFVINRNAARSIGLGNLHQLNKADKVQKFATGGSVGGISSIGGAALTFAPLLLSLGDLSDSNKKLTSTLTSLGAQFLTFQFLLGQLKSLSPGDTIESKIASASARRDLSLNDKSITDQKLADLEEANRKLLRRRDRVENIGNQARINEAGARSVANNPNLRPTLRLQALEAADNELALLNRTSTELVNIGNKNRNQNTAIGFTRNDQKIINDRLEAENKTIKSLTNFNTGLGLAETGLLLASAAAITFGQQIQNTGIANIRSGNTAQGRQQIINAGRLSGAGQGLGLGASAIGIGAQVGLAFGPVGAGIGAGIGAAIGAGIAGVSTLIGVKIGESAATKLATELERQVSFEAALKPFQRTLEAVSSGKIQSTTGAFGIAAGSNVLLRNLQTASPEGKESAKGQIDAAVLQIDQFLQKLASGSKTLDEFRTKAGDTLANFAIFRSIPLAEVIKDYETQIEVHNKANAIQQALAVSQERQLVRLREFNNLSAAVKDASLALDIFSVSLDSSESFISGGSGSTKFLDRSSVFDRVGNITNTAQFRSVVSQTAGFLGPSSNTGANELLQVNEIIGQLPNILAEVVAQSPNDADALELRFEDALNNAGTPKFLGDILRANLAEQLGPEQKSEKFFSEARDNITGLTDKLAQGSFKDIIDFFSEQAKLLTDHNNKIAAIFEKQRGIEGKRLGVAQQFSSNLEAQEEFNRSVNDSPIGLADAQRSDVRKLGTFGVGNLSGADAGRRIIDLQNSIVTKEVEIQNKEGAARDALLAKLAEERNEVDRLNSYLGYLGDAAARNTQLLQVQSRFIEERQTRRGIAEDFIFGGQGAKQSIITGAAGAAQLSKTNDINSLPAFAQGEAFDFLKRLGNTQLGILGGKSGEDVIKNTITKFLTNQGVEAGEAKKIAGLAASGPEQEVTNAINQNFLEANKVAITQRDILSNILAQLQEQERAATSRFEANKADLTRRAEITNVSGQLGSLQAQRSSLLGSQGSIAEINKLVAGTGLSGADLFKNFDTIKSLKQNRETNSKLVTSKNFDAKFLESITGKAEDLRKTFRPEDAIPIIGTDLRNFRNIKAESSAEGIISQLTGNQVLAKTIIGDKKGISFAELEDIFKGIENKFNNPVFAQQFREGINNNAQSTPNGISSIEFIKAVDATLKSTLAKNAQNLAQNQAKEKEFRDTTGASAEGLTAIFGLLKILEPLIKKVDTFNPEAIATAINNLNATLARLKGFASGGKVGGRGNRDSVLAKVMPGEFILNKKAAAAIGDDELFAMNGMARGGVARPSYRQRVKAFRNSQNFNNRIQERIDAKNLANQRSFDRNTRDNKRGTAGEYFSYAGAGRAAFRNKTLLETNRLDKMARRGFANGGYVPGTGNKDSVPALLMPGEFVMNKGAVQKIGLGPLSAANKKGTQKFADGGIVNGTSNITINPEISQIFARFDSSVSKLATALESMPHTINMSVRHTVEVIHNGAEVFASLTPAMKELCVKTTERALNTMLKDKFPDLGSIQ